MTILSRLVLVAAFGLPACSAQPGEFEVNAADAQSEQSAFCDARAVVAEKCVRCHADPPVNGAPFSLVTYDDMTAPSPSSKNPDRTRADRMLTAVESGLMPFVSLRLEPPVEPLTCEEKATLLAWLRAGAPPAPSGENACENAETELLACDAEP
jgi:uncharacterized membrane protein